MATTSGRKGQVVTPLIDTTEMYLRTIWELEEEGITPIRARLVDRLALSAPAVSETVARLEAEGLVHVAPDRTLELTDVGRALAVSVMRKHRLAERLLVDVIGLAWEHVHAEACRWEHVISDAVEERLVQVLNAPERDPHGNPIPGVAPAADPTAVASLAHAAKNGGRAEISRISEKLQGDTDAMRFLRQHGLRPGTAVGLDVDSGQVVVTAGEARIPVPEHVAEYVYVTGA